MSGLWFRRGCARRAANPNPNPNPNPNLNPDPDPNPKPAGHIDVAAHDAQLAAVPVEPEQQLREGGGLPRLQGAQLDAGVLGPRLVLLLQSGRGHGRQLGRAVGALRVPPLRIVAFLPPPRPRGLGHRHVLAMQLPGAQKKRRLRAGVLFYPGGSHGYAKAVADFFHGLTAC